MSAAKPDEHRWPAPICNYYGRPTLVRRGESWVVVLDNYDTERATDVSEDFAKAWIAQFPPPPPKPCWDCSGTGTWAPAPDWPDGCTCITCGGSGTIVEHSDQ